MPSKQTTNYKLSQWVKTDKVLMDDFNDDNAKIDAAVKAVDVKADSKADQSALESLKQTVAKKAEQSDLSDLRTAMGGKGNCRIWTTSYVGAGTHSQSNPRKLTFPAKPEIVFIAMRGRDGARLTVLYGQTYVLNFSTYPTVNYISWDGNTMSWYSTGNSAAQLDEANSDYDVVALIAES